ncbi:DNRLRE domain-containing protein [Nonomuraea bangladeshensis]|uniref:DNRLRE domain-containing protein n=1 Tax=Nonomuraea bangladeshensis TaxID=404385 RepID=UPI003C2FD897
MELNLEPVRVKNADGNGFTPIDTTLVETGGVIKPKAVPGDLTLSAGGDTTAIKTKDAKATARVDATRKLPEPTLKGNIATYPSAYGNGVDLVVTATPTGFRQQIVIRERPAGPVSFRIPMELPKGLSFGKNDKGQPTLKGKDGKPFLDIRPAPLLDAVAADPSGDLEAAKVGRAAVTLDGSDLVYSPDPAFLADPATTYPVTMAAVDDDWYECEIDTPSSTYCPDGVSSPYDGEPMDTFVNNDAYPDSWSNFNLDRILVGKSTNGSVRWRSYIQFPLPAKSDPFWGSRIENADLTLWNHLSSDCGLRVGSGITARRVISDWDELEMTWSNQPSVTNVGANTEYGAYNSANCTGAYNYEWDLIHSINGIVQEWANGEPNYGIQLTAGNESDTTNWRRYRTRESTYPYPAHAPRLSVDFEPKQPRAVVLLKPGEQVPVTREELEAFAAQGRLRGTQPSPDPVTAAEMEAAVANASDASTISTDDLQSPLPAPEDGVAARWSFAEGAGDAAADTSGNDHQAVVNDGVTWTPGVTDSALSNVGVAGVGAKATAGQRLEPARQAAAQRAVATGKPVEVAEATTGTSITYAQPDGKTFRTEVTTGPVRTRQSSGWVPIDTTLAEQSGKLRPKTLAEGTVVEFSAGGADPFVKMAVDGKSYALRWPTPLPKPTVKGSVATYTDAAGAGADLVVTALPDGFRHEVVLRQRPSKPLKLRIGVEDEGLTLSEGKNGRLLLKGKNQKLVAAAAPAAAWDSAKGRPARRGAATSDLVTKDGRTELVIEPDQAFLADVGTAYPVSVAAAVTLPGMTDVWISNYGTPGYSTYRNTTLWVGTYDEGEPAPWVERAFLKFDTAALANTNVSAATLSMRRTDAIGCGDARSGIKAQRVTAAWTDVELTWENQPGTATAGEAVANDTATCGAPGTMSWNLAAMAQAWASGSANHGLMLRGVDEILDGRPQYDRAFDSFNATNKPTLNVTYTLGSTPTVAGLQISPATSAGGTVTATSLTPQLAATVADTAGGNLTGQFEIEHDPAAPSGQGTGQIWTGTSSAVASGSQATASVPAGKLTDGWKIRWRARAANATTSSASAWSDWQAATVDVPNPAVGAFQVTPSQVVDGVTVATSLSPALRATVTDPAAQPLRAEFEVEHDPAAPSGQGSGQIWAGGLDGVVSGTQATATVPDGKLTDGWRVRWRVRAVNTATTVGSPWSDWQNLTVDVPDPASEPAIGALQVSPSEQVDGVTITSTPTPTLLAQVLDPAGKPLRAEAEVEHDPAAPDGQGSGQIWTGGADNVPAGSPASLTIPTGTLIDGWKVRWRARAVSATAASAWSDWQSFTVRLPKPTVTGPVITPSKVVDGVTTTTTLTPTLKATLTHPTGQALRAEVEIEHDPAAPEGQGTGQIWAGAVDNVPSGTQAAVTVPSGTLTDGWKIRWRVRAVAGDVSSAWSDWQQAAVDVTQNGGQPLARTAGPVIRTDESFTVAAWVRWSDTSGAYTILEQKGSHNAPFRLGNDPEKGLIFTLTAADAASAPAEGVLSGVKPAPNVWFHIAAVYDKTASAVTLYLNGDEVGLPDVDESDDDVDATPSAPISFPAWNSTGPLTLGTDMNGSLDEVWVYDRALSYLEVNYLVDGSLIQDEAATMGQDTSRSTVRMMAKEPMKYDRVKPEECWEEFEKSGKNKAFWAKNRFSSCQTHLVKFISDGADNGHFYLMLVASTFNGSDGQSAGQTSRDMYFDVYVREFVYTDYDFLDGEYTVGLSPAKGQTACRHITQWNGQPQHNNIMKTGDELRVLGHPLDEDYEKVATWRFRAAPGDTSGTDLISNCNFSPWVKTEGDWDDPIKPEWGYGATPQDFKLRCDSASYFNLQFQGGCVAPVVASIEWKLGSDYDVAYKHLWKACYDKADTYPVKPDKVIKGCYNYSTNKIPNKEDRLTWATDTVGKQNRGRATTRCRSLWPGYGTATPTPQDCDEFPPASARERTPASDKARNFSVCAMDGTEQGPNQKAGAHLYRFYNRERIMRAGLDAWFNRFSSPQMPNIEKMDDLCWKAADKNSRYAKPGLVP